MNLNITGFGEEKSDMNYAGVRIEIVQCSENVNLIANSKSFQIGSSIISLSNTIGKRTKVMFSAKLYFCWVAESYSYTVCMITIDV